MRVSINLATRPYVELGPVYRRLRLLIVALAVLALPLWLLLHSETRKAAAAHARLETAQQHLTALERQEQSYRSDMLQPQNASILRQSQFLNTLFERKAFSWTAVMMDLERVLPGGVQVENIDPVIASNGEVTIRLRVSGEHDRAVDLVRNLEHSKRFLFPRIADEAAETTAQGGRGLEQVSNNGVNFDILAGYNPLPVSAEIENSAPAAKSPAQTAETPVRRHKAQPQQLRGAARGRARLPAAKAGPR